MGGLDEHLDVGVPSVGLGRFRGLARFEFTAVNQEEQTGPIARPNEKREMFWTCDWSEVLCPIARPGFSVQWRGRVQCPPVTASVTVGLPTRHRKASLT